MILTFLLMAGAHAAELRPVRAGETVESIAATLGDPELAEAIRAANGLGSSAQPTVGQLLRLPPPPGVASDQEAFLIAKTGKVTVQDPGAAVQPAALFSSIPTGSTVCSGSQSYATLRLSTQCGPDGSGGDDVVLYEQTCVVVESVFGSTLGRGTVVRVTRGSVAVQYVQGAEGHITVLTESGVTTSTEGGFRVHLEESAMRTEALDGEVAVQGAGEEVLLDPGQGSRVRTGEAPSQPVDLERSGGLERPEDGDVLLRPDFTWATADPAFGHRFEMSSDLVFSVLVYATTVGEPRHQPSLLMLPTDISELWWRVSPVDRFGFIGMPSSPRRVELPAAVAP